VNNAGVQYPQESIEQIDDKQLQLTFETNVYPLFYITREVVKQMTSGDSIINTTSITAYRGHDILIDYASTKGAILSFTRSLSGNLAKKNIRVNAVAPGPIWTPLIPSTFDEVSDFGQNSPLGRPGQPSEVAPAFVYLAGADSSYVTGQVIHVNGGSVVGG
jgi:NAD(P)-dependent dehydrogenase (short-subunit alcohol dehydrogenase family)